MTNNDDNRPFNTHEQLHAAGGGVALVPKTEMTRAARPRQVAWQVYVVDAQGNEVVTDKGAAWYDNRRRTFLFFNADSKDEALREAKDWVAQFLPDLCPRKWVRNRYGDWLDVNVHTRFPLRPLRPAKPRSKTHRQVPA